MRIIDVLSATPTEQMYSWVTKYTYCYSNDCFRAIFSEKVLTGSQFDHCGNNSLFHSCPSVRAQPAEGPSWQARILSKRLARQFCAEQLPSTLRRVCINTWCRTFPSLLPQVSPQEKVLFNSSIVSSFTPLRKVKVLLTEKGMEGNLTLSLPKRPKGNALLFPERPKVAKHTKTILVTLYAPASQDLSCAFVLLLRIEINQSYLANCA